MPAGSNPSRIQRLAAESILATPNLTDELTDDQAEPMIQWGLAQAKVAADFGLVSHLLAFLSGDDLRQAALNRTGPVRRVMRAVNSLAADRHGLSPDEIFEELEYIIDLARGLPIPPDLPLAENTLAELAAWQAELDNGAFVWAMLTLLGAEPPAETKSTDQDSELGDIDDRQRETEDPAGNRGHRGEAGYRETGGLRDGGPGDEGEHRAEGERGEGPAESRERTRRQGPHLSRARFRKE